MLSLNFIREHPDLVQGILTGIQNELGDDQIVSARLLPSLGAPSEATPLEDEPEPEAEAEAEGRIEAEVTAGTD